MHKYHFRHDWGPSEIIGFHFMIFVFIFVIVSIVAITVKDATVRQDCIKAGGNMEYGECRLPERD